MLLPFLVATVAAVSPAAGTYVGTTSEHEPVRLVVRGGHVASAKANVASYRCEPDGELGGRTVVRTVDVPIRRGAFRFDAGPMPEFLKMTGTATRRTVIRGKLRVHGTIATGHPCTSRTVRYTVTRR